MNKDLEYQKNYFSLPEQPHHYSKQLHLLTSPFSQTILSEIGSPNCQQPRVNHLIKVAYDWMLTQVLNHCVKTVCVNKQTRMAEKNKCGHYEGIHFDLNTSFVVLDIARAGTMPAQICFDYLNHLFNPQLVRQDHIYINRKTDAEGKVIGLDLSGSKIGGKIDDKILLVPDPMGATGGTIIEIQKLYQTNGYGKSAKTIALHLIVTPEYVQRLSLQCPDVEIFALRFDRGLSTQRALDSKVGEFAQEEKGLNEVQYIIPGAGGMGEVMNNSYV